jgi:hypothetical protein
MTDASLREFSHLVISSIDLVIELIQSTSQ